MPRSDLGGEPFGLCASSGFANGAGGGRGRGSLEAKLMAGRAHLATAAVAGSVGDPQASDWLGSLVPMKVPSARALPCCWPALSRWLRRWALRWRPWRLHATNNRLRRLGVWRVHQTRRVRKRKPGVRPGPRRAGAGFRPSTRPPVAGDVGPAPRVPWQVRGTASTASSGVRAGFAGALAYKAAIVLQGRPP